ncbi:MAG: hypothetical protein JO203_08625 [Gammaproteobacteria bacterium]|nr:hypothetical protein [Gammaproteobacteria bacterium]
MSADARGWRVALLPDALLNPPAAVSLPDVLRILESNGYGVLQLPPPGNHTLLLAVTADQVAEYSHHGYATVAIGLQGVAGDGLHWRRLAPLLRRRGVALPPRHVVRPQAEVAAEGQRLAAFLRGYDLPPEEQRRWRGERSEVSGS